MSLDLISNMLSSLKNASMAGKEKIEVSYSKQCEEIAKLLKEKGFLSEVKVFKPKEASYKKLALTLAQDEGGNFKLTDVKRISKPGRRLYQGVHELHKISGGFGMSVLSTPKGILDGASARKKNVGGEIICEVL